MTLTWRRILVRIGGEQMLSWGGANPEQTLHALLQAVAVLLKPGAGDSASFGIGEVSAFPLWRSCGPSVGHGAAIVFSVLPADL